MRRASALVAAAVASVAVAGSLLARADSTVAYDPIAATAPAAAAGNLLVGSDAPGAWTLPATLGRVAPRGSAAAVSLLRATPAALERSTGTPVQPHSVYVGTFASRAQSGSAPATALLTWFDAQGRHLVGDDVRSAKVADTADGWTTYQVAGLTPATAATVRLVATYEPVQAGTLHYLAGSSLTARPQGSADLRGPLTTQGTTVRDATGAVVTLRGVNRPGQWDTAQPGGLDAQDVARIKAWGGNVVRLTLGQQKWLPGCASYDPGYRAAVARTVRLVNDVGMLAVLDLHFGAPTCGAVGNNPMPDGRSLVFWEQVARAYRDRPLVAFDLYNEPYGVSPAVWSDGGPAMTSHGVRYRAVGLRTLYRAVRATGARNLVLVGGLDRASSVPGDRWFVGSNLVWAVHSYVCDLPWRCGATDADARLRTFADVTRRLPVFVTEFGHPASRSGDGASFNASVIAFAEAHRWSWAVWAWDVHGTCRQQQYFNLLTSTSCATGTGTYEPSPAGVPVLVGLARNS